VKKKLKRISLKASDIHGPNMAAQGHRAGSPLEQAQQTLAGAARNMLAASSNSPCSTRHCTQTEKQH